MASTGQPLGVGLSIDFARLDSDLSKVADRIDKVGSETTLKVGTLSGMSSGGGIDTERLGAQMAMVGTKLSQGMISGVGASSALLLSFAAKISATLDRLAGVTISLFTRIDAAMRFPRFDSALSRWHTGLKNVWSGARKDVTDLDVALSGGLGTIAKKAAQIFKVLFADMGKSISVPIEKALGGIVPAVNEMADRMVAAMDAAARSIDRSMTKAIEGISTKFKGLKMVAGASGEASAEALMHGFQAKSSGLKTARLAEFSKGSKETIDLGDKIKPPSKTAIKEYFTELKKGFKEMSPKTYEELFADMKPARAKSPPQRAFAGRVAEPQLGKGFQETGKGLMEAGRQGAQAIATGVMTATKAWVQFNREVKTADDAIKLIGKSMGGWGQLIALPLGAMTKLAVVTVRVGMGFVDMGILAVRKLNRIHNLITSIGGIGDKTFKELFVSHGLFLGGLLVSIKVLKSFTVGLFNLATFGIFKRAKNDVDLLNASVKAGEPIMGKLGRTVASVGSQMVAAFGVIGLVYKVVEFFKGGVKGATELNATVIRSKAVFGESFGEVAGQAATMSANFKIAKAPLLELSSEFGSMAQGAGVSEAASASLANQLTSLAVDATGLGIPLADVSEAMKTGLSGRAISLKQFAVNIDENTTKAYAWKTGIAQAGQELTTQQTLMARAGQIMRGLSYAEGALARNAGQAGVQFKMAGGGLSLFAEKIGEMVLPGLKAAAVGFNEMMGGVLDLVGNSGPAITAWAEQGAQNVQDFIGAVKGFGPQVVANITWAWGEAKKGPLGFVIESTEAVYRFVTAIPEAIGIGIRNAGTLWEIAKLQAGAFVENVLRYVGTIPENFGRIFDWLGRNWYNLIVDLSEVFARFQQNLLVNAVNLGKALWDAIQGKGFTFEFTPLLEGFKSVTEKLPDMIKPDLVDVGDQVKKLYEKIGQDELKRPRFKGEGETPGGEKMKPIEGADKSKEYKLGGALEAGSKEAVSAISKGQSGRGSTTDAVKQGIIVQKDIHKAINQQTEVIKNKAFTPALSVK